MATSELWLSNPAGGHDPRAEEHIHCASTNRATWHLRKAIFTSAPQKLSSSSLNTWTVGLIQIQSKCLIGS